MATREEQLEAIQHFGSQHPQFHSKEMREHRKKAKSEALKRKKEGMASKIPKGVKLQRDHVISGTPKGDRVGVYYMRGKKEHLVGEYHPKKADEMLRKHNT